LLVVDFSTLCLAQAAKNGRFCPGNDRFLKTGETQKSPYADELRDVETIKEPFTTEQPGTASICSSRERICSRAPLIVRFKTTSSSQATGGTTAATDWLSFCMIRYCSPEISVILGKSSCSLNARIRESLKIKAKTGLNVTKMRFLLLYAQKNLCKQNPQCFYKGEIYGGWFCYDALFRFGPTPDNGKKSMGVGPFP
jgi:hypothetical protein